MKRILITGVGSYIGTSFETFLRERYPADFEIDTLDMTESVWREKDFSGYDTVFHVAGIAHSDGGEISPERRALYYSVNTDLAVETAERAKAAGVSQFIFMSSAIVYGESAPLGKEKHITRDTPVSPANCYGDSKVQAERGLLPLADGRFAVAILRPPMIYGRACRGNYNALRRLALRMPLFPRVENRRSMLYIGNLCAFLKCLVERGEGGLFFPQNAEYVSTSAMVQAIAAAHGKRLRTVRGFTWLLRLVGCATGLVRKAFGSFSYDAEMSRAPFSYQEYSFEESIRLTEEV